MKKEKKNKPKILRIITRLERGGVPYEVLEVTRSKEINKFFDQVLVSGYCENEIEIPPDIKILRVKNLVRDVSLVKDIFALIELIKIILLEKPDIIHAHTSKAGFIGRLAGFICKVPYKIYSPHGHIFSGYFSKPKTFLFKFLEFIAGKFTDVLVVRTEDEKEAFENVGYRGRFFFIPKAEVKLPNQKERQKISESKTNEEIEKIKDKIIGLKNSGVKIVGTISRLEPVKGIEYLIRAFSLLLKDLDQKIFLLIVGDGSERKRLQELAEKILGKENFLFTGWIYPPDDFYPLFDVFCVPSLNEAWGVTIIEAGKFGIPIVASSVGGIPYFAGGYVLLVPPRNEQKLKEAIKKILENEELRKILSEKSYELSQKYTKDSMIKRYLELYLSLYKVKNS
jgi:glycosyltransferase involved in cell wall biosynthesis